MADFVFKPFNQLNPSMIMFIVRYDGVVKLPELYKDVTPDPQYAGACKDMPVGPDGTIVSKGYGKDREGALRTSRSTDCFKNAVSVDISALGGNVNFKISETKSFQASGARFIAQANYATRLLIDYLNTLPCQAEHPLTYVGYRVERVNLNFEVPMKLKLSAVALLIKDYEGLSVVYDNVLDQGLRAARVARRADAIIQQRSSRSKQSKVPAHMLTIRYSGKIMLGGPDIEELEEIYNAFAAWYKIHAEAIRMV